MKQYLMTGIAAIAMCAAFTSCSHDLGFEQMTQEEVMQSKYEAAFIKAFGQPSPDQDWGFGSHSTTRTAYTNSNMWESDGLTVPAAITTREHDVVMEYFRTTPNPRSETVNLQNYFIQNVGYTDHTYPGEGVELKDNNGHDVTITNPGTNHMDWIFVGPGAEATAWNDPTPKPFTWNDGDDHVNDFNANSGKIQYIKYSGSEWFGFHDSYGAGYSTPGHGDNGKYCAVNRNFVIRFIDVDGEVGCYVGFNYESGKTSEGWHLEPDAYFDDRVIKLVPGEGGITPPSTEYQGRIMAEDLNAGEKSDFDFNDVVFDWKIEDNVATIQLRAAGGTLPLYVGGEEVHDKFGVFLNDMVNTGVKRAALPEPYTYTFPDGVAAEAINIPIEVTKGGVTAPLTAQKGKVASKINVSTDTKWIIEYKDITLGYPDFTGWIQNPSEDWTSNYNSAYLYNY